VVVRWWFRQQHRPAW